MKLLLIGNSHTYYNAMPQILQDLFAAVPMGTERSPVELDTGVG